MGTASSMVRSSGYESSLIARDTYKSAETKGYINYLNSDPALKNKAETLINQGYTDEQIIDVAITFFSI